MNNILKERAITLIALIITIVVLIILAGVAISLSLGENGLFKKAKIGAEEYTNVQRTEETEIAKMTNDINTYVNSNRDYEEEINRLNTKIEELENLNSFSTEEKVIGKWVDGKPLYKKTYATNITINSSDYVVSSITNIANIKRIVDAEVIGVDTSYYSSQLFPARVDFLKNSQFPNGIIRIGGLSSGTYIDYITIQYTKTTD